MTCIAGVTDGRRVTIGGDSAGVSGWHMTDRADAKVWKTAGWAFGFTTSFRMGQLLRWSFSPPAITEGPLERYMATTFVDAVRQVLKDGGYAKVESGREEGGDFLVGHVGRLFAVHSDFQVAEARIGMLAVGCGNELALGAMRAQPANRPPRARVRRALEVAAELSAGVAGPFSIVTV